MNVFPLPLNAVEQYMLADDSAEYPRCFSVVLRLNESLDEQRLVGAINAATRRHPLLRALVRFDKDGPIEWIAAPDAQYSVEWRSALVGASTCDQRSVSGFDLKREPGVRFAVNRDAAGDRLAVEFHHACTDGLGAIQFVHDLLVCYGLGGTNSEQEFPPLDVDRLRTRDDFGLGGWRRAIRWLIGTIGWIGAIEFLTHRPAPLGELPVASADRNDSARGFYSQTLSTTATAALLSTAKQSGVTVNDLMMRDLFLTNQAFLATHWPDRAKRHQRIMVPVNLRSAADQVLPAANVVAMVHLDRRPYRWADANRLLRVLHWELAAVKRLRLGIVFVQILAMLQWLFGSLRRFLPTDRCQATCVASNLGVVLPAFDRNELGGVEFYPPIRPLTAAAFGVATHGGALTVSLQFDAAALSAEQGTELLNRYVAKLHETCGVAR